MDLKVSSGYRARVVVEMKLSSNPKLVRGFERQIGEYSKAEKADHAIYAVIDVGNPGKWRERLSQAAKNAKSDGQPVPEIFDIDGRLKKSASKM